MQNSPNASDPDTEKLSEAITTPAPTETAAAAQTSLHEFHRQAWPISNPSIPYQDNWHVGAICDHLEALSLGQIENLVINVPPGTGKSTIAQVNFPAWTWLNDPAQRFLCASYNIGLSVRDSVMCRNVINSFWYSANWGDRFNILPDQNQKTIFRNDCSGWRMATSVAGAATGEHPTIVIIDDPHKVKNVESEDERKAVTDWYDGTIITRGITSKVRRAIIAQRTHDGDLCGHIRKTPIEGEEWTWLVLPMEYEPNRMTMTPIGWIDPRREPDELLWPEVITAPKVRLLKLRLAGRAAGQLQQRPTKKGGDMFPESRWEIISSEPNFVRQLRYTDKAGTEGGGAYTSSVRMGVTSKGKFVVADVRRGQWAYDNRCVVMKNTAMMDRQQFGGRVRQVIEREGGSAGKDVALLEVRMLSGHNVEIDYVTGRGSKEIRAEPYSAQQKEGNVALVAADWNADFVAEHTSFPNGEYKDQVDAASGAFFKLSQFIDGILDGDLIASGGEDEEEDVELTEFLKMVVGDDL